MMSGQELFTIMTSEEKEDEADEEERGNRASGSVSFSRVSSLFIPGVHG
jgi:hypothetical protein